MSYPSTNEQLSALHALAKVDVQARDRFHKQVGDALASTGGDIRHAAVALGVGRTTLDRWICEGGMQGTLMQRLIEERKKTAAKKQAGRKR